MKSELVITCGHRASTSANPPAWSLRRTRALLAVVLTLAYASGQSQTFQDLHVFSCDWTDHGWNCVRGLWPQGALVQGKEGNFYGTTAVGGKWASGTIFKVSPEGEFTTLAHFDGTNGYWPYGALLE